jgi:hypothetical protein
MDVREYIASGTLELYAMGILSPEEMLEVSDIAVKYPEIKVEIRKIELMMEQYATAHGKEPRAELKNSIIQKIKEAPSVPQVIQPEISGTRDISFTQLMVAASVTILLVGNIFLFYKWQSVQRNLNSMISQNYQLAQGYNALKAKNLQSSNDLAMISNEGVRKIALKGMTKKNSSALAIVYWNEKSNETFIDIKNLPMPKEGKQYQLWAIMDGKPFDAGIIKMDSTENKLQKLKDIKAAQILAITLEEMKGSPAPTMDEMVLFAKL